MAISITINGSVTLDESAGLQNTNVAAGAEDNNDSDVSLATLQAQAGAFYTRLFTTLGLSSAFATANGVAKSADNFISLSGTGNINSLGFVDASGNALPVLGSGTGATCNLLAVDGGAITLFSDASLGNRVAYGVDTQGNIVFALYMDPAAGLASAKVWMVQFEALANTNPANHDDPLAMTGLGVGAGVSSEFSFAGLPSGQNLFGMVGSTTSALIVIGKSPVLNPDGTFTNASNTINTSQGGGNTTIGVNNQMFDPGEGAYFTFVKGANNNFLGSNLDANEADDADNMLYTDGNAGTNDTIESDSAFLRIAQIQGGSLASLKLTAYNIAGSPQGTALIAASGQNAVAITQVKVYNAAGTLIEDTADLAHFNSATVSVTFSGGVATVNGLDAGYKVEWFTGNPNVKFDQVLVEGVSGKFDIGGFGVNEPTAVSVPLTGIRFEDDGPAVDLVLNPTAELRLDETDNDADDLNVGGILATNTLAAGAYLSTNTASFGTDGPAAANPTVWSLSLAGANPAGVDSGLDDAATNSNVMLFVVNSTTIEGRVGGSGGALVLTISINSANGALTVTQNRAVEHNDPGDPDENGLSSAMMNSLLVFAVRTATDGDGDSANDSVDVSQVIKLEDDGPSVDLILNGTAELRLDETDNDADDLAVGGILATNSLAAAAYLTKDEALFGSDGPAAANPTVWSLALTGANPGGVDSGLDDAATDSNVMLFLVNSTTIEGRVGGSGGALVMTITINSSNGTLTVVQNRAVEHNDPGDPDENGLSSAMMNSGLVSAVRTATDGDGDSASDSVDVSQVIKLEDDGPSVDLVLNGSAELRLDETDNDADDLAVGGILATNSLSTAGYLTTNNAFFGSDGPAGASPTVWSLGVTGANPAGVDSGLDDTLSGSDVMLFVVNSTTVEGRAGGSGGPLVMTITINASNGTLTVVQNRAVEHNDPGDPDENGLSSAMMNAGLVSAIRTATDGDGDSASDSVDISQVIKLEDDGPSVDVELDGDAELVVDETDLPASASILVGDILSINSASFGSDGEGADASSYKLTLGNANSGLTDTLTLDPVLLSINLDGTKITGSVNAGADVVFEIEVDPDTGEVTVTQYRAMVNGDAADPDESDTPNVLANGTVGLERTVTDGDGDSDSDSTDISPIFKFEDDGPALPPVGQPASILGTDDTDIADLATISTDILFPGAPDYGNDGPHAVNPLIYELRLATANAASGLIDTETGDVIRLVKVGDDIVGYVDEDGNGSISATETLEAIRYTLAPFDADTKIVNFTQSRAVYHDTANPEQVFANLVFVDRTAIDGDGDVSQVRSFDLGAITFIEDDEPEIGPISDGLVDFQKDDFVTKSLNGVVGNDPNSSPYVLTAYTTSLTVNGVELHAILAGDAKSVVYWDDKGGNGTYGDAGDTAYYKLELGDQGGAGDYTFTVLVDPPPAFSDFDFSDLPSGQNLFGCIADDKANLDGFALFVISKNADVNNPGDGQMTNVSGTVNTSKGGGPVTIGDSNQMFDPNEGAYFVYLDNPINSMVAGVPGGLTQNTADDADTIGFEGTVEARSASVEIVQVQGGALASMNIKAFDIDMAPFGAGGVNTSGEARSFAEDPEATDDPINITAVRVKTAAGVLLESWADTDLDGVYELQNIPGQDNHAQVNVVFHETSPGSGIYYATVSGVNAGYTIEFDTETDHDMTLVEGVSGKYDIGGFNVFQRDDTPDQLLEFTAQVTDGDGDTDTASWKVGIDGTGIFDDNNVVGLSII